MEKAVLPMAEVALETGQLETAKRLYQRLLDMDPNSVGARMGLGDIAFRRGDSTEAARWHLAAVAHAEQPEQRHAALLAHGRAALDAGQLEAARNSFAQLADPREQAPSASVAWGLNGVGLTLLLEGDLRGAIANMEQAVQRAPSESVFQENLERALAMFAEAGHEDVRASSSPAPAKETRASSSPAPAKDTRASSSPAPAAAVTITDSSAAPGGADAATEPEANLVAAPEPVARSEEATDDQEAPPIDSAGSREAPPIETEVALPGAEADSPTTSGSVASDAAEPSGADAVVDPEAGLVAASEPVAGSGEATDDQEVPPIETEVALPGAEADSPTIGWSVASDATDEDKAEEFGGFVVHEDGQQFVQMGAYRHRSTAQTLAALLRDATDQSVRVVDLPALHRVRIGPIDSREALMALVEDLRSAGYGAVRLPSSSAKDPTGQAAAEQANAAPAEAPPQFTIEQRAQAFVVQENGSRFLQFGAYRDRDAAETLATRLRDSTGAPAHVSEAEIDGTTLHRVRAGPIDSEDALRNLVEAAESIGFAVD